MIILSNDVRQAHNKNDSWPWTPVGVGA